MKYKDKSVQVLEIKKGEFFHVDDTYSLMNQTHHLWFNIDLYTGEPNDTSDDLKALKSFKVTVIIEHN